MKFILVFLLTFGSLYGLSIDVQESYPDALKKAKEEKKPLLIYLYMLNCHTCEYMEKHVFTDKAVHDYLAKNYVVVHLYTNNRELPSDWRVEMSPVFHFINAQNGEMIESIMGGRCAKRFLKLLQNSYLDYKEETN